MREAQRRSYQGLKTNGRDPFKSLYKSGKLLDQEELHEG
jgi:hypothetical protein